MQVDEEPDSRHGIYRSVSQLLVQRNLLRPQPKKRVDHEIRGELRSEALCLHSEEPPEGETFANAEKLKPQWYSLLLLAEQAAKRKLFLRIPPTFLVGFDEDDTRVLYNDPARGHVVVRRSNVSLEL